jgi:hypothetical protein
MSAQTEEAKVALAFVLGLRLALEDPETAGAIVEAWTRLQANTLEEPLEQVAGAHREAALRFGAHLAEGLARALR